MDIILGALQLGLLYALMALGVYITFRILNIPDLTVDGSFTLGLALSAVFAIKGHPYIGIVTAIVGGAAAGLCTGLLHTKVKIHPILSGILTMTALYSVNLYIMGSSANISLMGAPTIFNQFIHLLGNTPLAISRLILCALLCIVVVFLMGILFQTQLGMSIRATGDNEDMVSSSSINPAFTKCITLAIANALVALSGAFIAQYQNFADISSGSGMVVIGLASVIIGEAIFGRRSVTLGLICAAVGSIIYRIIIAIALQTKIFPAFALKLVSSIIVVIALALPVIQKNLADSKMRKEAQRRVNH